LCKKANLNLTTITGEIKYSYKILGGKTLKIRLIWEDTLKTDLKEMGCGSVD
jgi:hypothetical protein